MKDAKVPKGCRIVYILTGQTVTFDANGGTCGTAKKRYSLGKAYGKLPKATRAGHAFLGWYTAASGGTKVTAKDKVPRRAKRRLYAHWTARQTVKFDANGGTCRTAAQKHRIGKPYGALPTATRRGYVFKGWATAASGGTKVARTDKATAAVRTLYARWSPTTYKIAFDADGGTGTMATQSVKYDATANLRKNAFERTGYTFQGWAKTKTGEVVYANRQAVKNLRTDGKTTTLYAVWEKQVANSVTAETVGTSVPKSAKRTGTPAEVLVTASGGGDASAVVDGNEATSWTPGTAEGSWVVLTFAEPRDVEDVEVVGSNLPEGTRFLLSEDADRWTEDVPGNAQYLWVVFPASDMPPVVREIRVTP